MIFFKEEWHWLCKLDMKNENLYEHLLQSYHWEFSICDSAVETF